MHHDDPKVLSQLSQSLDDVVKSFDLLYKNSPLPFCIRDQSRKVVYRNDAYFDFFHPFSDNIFDVSFTSNEVELDLSLIELEAFVMGPDTAVCRTFNVKGEFYQLRVEVRLLNGQLFALWFINYFPDYQALFYTSNRKMVDGFDFDVFLSGLTTKKMVTLCFSLLGFQLCSMSKYLGVSEKAISSRLSSVKCDISRYFSSYDDFRLYCLKMDIYPKVRMIILKMLNVN